jgi:predicted amidohydrolase
MAELSAALVQMRCEKGAIEANLAAMRAYLEEAARRDVELVCFPEASITGYVDPVRYPDVVVTLDGPAVARFVALTRELPLTAIAGIIETNPLGLPFITQVVAAQGRLLGYYRKRTIPDEEAHLFTPGKESVIFSHLKGAFGLAICADSDTPAVFADCARLGARVVFEAAAPGLYGEQATRDWQASYAWWQGECLTKLARYAREHAICIAVATQAGRTRDEDFPGGGWLFGADGGCLASMPEWSEGVLYVQIPLG